MIVLDTHIWVWWVDGDAQLRSNHERLIKANEKTGIGVSAISCWEVAKIVELGRLTLSCAVLDWLTDALRYPGVALLPLTAEIAVESTQLPGTFHNDPADQVIVATARIFGCDLITADQKIRAYPHVNTP